MHSVISYYLWRAGMQSDLKLTLHIINITLDVPTYPNTY